MPRPMCDSAGIKLVMSAPPPFQRLAADSIPGSVGTLDALQELFAGARRTLKIFSPYVDASFSSLLRLARCPVRIVTTALERRRLRARPILERCSIGFPLTVRYVSEIQGGAQLFQMHAKMVVADRTAAYLGSANLTDTSLNYNLEMGVLIRDPAVVEQLDRVFDLVFEKLSVPAQMLRA